MYMQEVVQRLKLSKEECRRNDHHLGVIAGEEWATRTATFANLECLADWNRSHSAFPSDEDDDVSIKAIRNVTGLEWKDFQSLFGLRYVSKAVASGFMEGATQVWEEVVDEVCA
jgi:hypothetical protein